MVIGRSLARHTRVNLGVRRWIQLMFHFKCDRCDFTLDIAEVPRVYLFDDGRILTMQQRHIWCSSCGTVAVAELFCDESRNSRHELREYHRRDLERNNFKHDSERELRRKWIAESEQTDRDFSEWLALRTCPQHCLRCGNQDIVVPERDWDIPHGACGGVLRCTATIQGGTYTSPEPHKYSINGELIELGYWQSPGASDRKPLGLWWAHRA